MRELFQDLGLDLPEDCFCATGRGMLNVLYYMQPSMQVPALDSSII